MDAALVGWAAGFLDGEGSFQIDHPALRSFRIHVAASNTDVRALYRLQEMFGGSIRPGTAYMGYKPVYHWAIVAQRAAAAIRILLPHLLLKAEQAAVLLELQDRIDAMGGVGQKGLPADEVEARRALKARITVLNKRGVS